jgi:hypothetical protein
MPQTENLYPGKFVTVQGQPHFAPMVAPSYNGSLNPYAGNNANSTRQFKVFEMDDQGRIMSQNQCLKNQDVYDEREKNHDLTYYLRNFQQKPETYEEKYDLLLRVEQIKIPAPPRSIMYNVNN